MTDIVERRSKDNCVICPDCNHEFVAVPVDVQEELASLRQQLAECKALVVALRDALDTWDQLIQFQYNGTKEAMTALQKACDKGAAALALPSDSTALDIPDVIRQRRWQREALLEVAEMAKRYEWDSCYVRELKRMAKELE